MMDSDMWATLPCDLLVDIFRRLGSTAVIRSAGVCRPWRRTIIDNARRLRPRPDRFLPDLLLGFLNRDGNPCRFSGLQYVPSPEAVLALDSVLNVGPCDRPLASRDSFLLLRVRGKGNTGSNDLCLCNLLAGSCRFLSAAVVGVAFRQCSYVLATAYDDHPRLPDGDGDGDGAGGSDVRILAVTGEGNCVAYQISSSTTGFWDPVKRSAKFSDETAVVDVPDGPENAVVCSGPVFYCLVVLLAADTSTRTCLFAMDTRNERTWTTGLPKHFDEYMLVLATSEDGRRLSVIASEWEKKVHDRIEVWVLGGDRRWTLQRTMYLQSSIVPNWPRLEYTWVSAFCPRSGCLFGIGIANAYHGGPRQKFLIGVDGSSPRPIQMAGDVPYEMDWSTYISNMKCF